MNGAHPSAAWVRNFEPRDAPAISQLFRTVYGDHYVYPDVYEPSQIAHRHASAQWQSAVAVREGRLLGHATLWLNPTLPDTAELALNVVHPDARGHGIATLMGRHLCQWARERSYGLLTIKQVCSHLKSQYLAQSLGFHTSALLLDYVQSPFGLPEPESVVLGCMPLRPRPLPRVTWPVHWLDWVAPLVKCFGEADMPTNEAPEATESFACVERGRRLEVLLRYPITDHLLKVATLPKRKLVYLMLPASVKALTWHAVFRRDGFRFAGLLPGPMQSWLLLYIRGHLPPPASFIDERAWILSRLDG